MIANNRKFTRHNGQLSHHFPIGKINNLTQKKFLRKILEHNQPSPLFNFISNKKYEFFIFCTYETALCNFLCTKLAQTPIFFVLLKGGL